MVHTIAQILKGDTRDLGEFQVRRVLPKPQRRRIGPFVFFDEMGPADFSKGQGLNVRPHPHIGLSTVTYLFDGAIMHRDSLGVIQKIEPGAVNVMTAGRGIAHSERCSADECPAGTRMHGIQTWMALPVEEEECEPAFYHTPASDLPPVEPSPGVQARVILGDGFGQRSPAPIYMPTFYAHLEMTAGSAAPLPKDHEELAVYPVHGRVQIDGEALEAGDIAVLNTAAPCLLTAQDQARIMMFGGARLPEDRTIWWNFVSSRPERIEQAKDDWSVSIAAEFQGSPFKLPPDEHDHIPLPDTPQQQPTREEPTT
jgi:hypothetical protein